MNHKKRRQDRIAKDIQKEYTALAQLTKEKELGIICVQNDISKEDLFKYIQERRAKEDPDWTR